MLKKMRSAITFGKPTKNSETVNQLNATTQSSSSIILPSSSVDIIAECPIPVTEFFWFNSEQGAKMGDL